MSVIVEPKPGVDVGRVVVPVTIENVDDVRRAQRGEIAANQVRRLTVEALVDSGATFFCMPQSLIDLLGLPFNRDRRTKTISGEITLRVYGGARLHVQGRECDEEVMALP